VLMLLNCGEPVRKVNESMVDALMCGLRSDGRDGVAPEPGVDWGSEMRGGAVSVTAESERASVRG